MATTIADLLVETLASIGVERIWGVTGDSLNAVNDSLYRNGKIRFMHMRHEEAGAFAAGAEAAATGQLAVCAGSCGPGNLHLINGLFDCHRNRVPVLAIASHIPSSEIGLDYFQETHPQDLFRECSDFCELVTNPKQMPQVLHRAIRTAVGRRGVAVIVLPGDVSVLEVADAIPPLVLPEPPRTEPSPAVLDEAARMLAGAERVTILAGAGCAGARTEVIALADALQAPIVHAFRGKEVMEWDNPHDVGMTGLIGFASGYHAMKECDALLVLGSSFPYRNFYPDQAKVIQVDTDPSARGCAAPRPSAEGSLDHGRTQRLHRDAQRHPVLDRRAPSSGGAARRDREGLRRSGHGSRSVRRRHAHLRPAPSMRSIASTSLSHAGDGTLTARRLRVAFMAHHMPEQSRPTTAHGHGLITAGMNRTPDSGTPEQKPITTEPSDSYLTHRPIQYRPSRSPCR